jgi:AcrR family transcriptional regulator
MSSATPKRAYQQRVRAEAAAETRRRIIEVTRECLTRVPLENVGLPEIAAAAGVARSTIYADFGSREGLMFAVAEDLLERAGFDRLGRAVRHPNAMVALETSLREASRIYAAEYPVSRALLRLAAVDRDAARGAARLEFGRREGIDDLAQRLRKQGALRSGVTQREAADVLWVITSFETFDQLFGARELTVEQTATRLIAMAKRTLCAED